MNLSQEYEPVIRLASFFGVFLIMILWELAAPRRPVITSHWWRVANNLFLVIINTVILRLIPAFAAVGTAAYIAEREIGLLHLFTIPDWLAILLAFVLLDLAIYFQHIIFHKIPWLWRLHRVHHTDKEFDVSTGIRFHPVEIILSMVIKIAVVFVIGAPVAAVILFEIILNATSLFNHGNVRLPLQLDRIIRLFIVTPDTHRVHHSVIKQETDSNFGFNFSFWDRLFRTYRAQPAEGHDKMEVGLTEFKEMNTVNILSLITQPLITPDNKA